MSDVTNLDDWRARKLEWQVDEATDETDGAEYAAPFVSADGTTRKIGVRCRLTDGGGHVQGVVMTGAQARQLAVRLIELAAEADRLNEGET